MALRHAPDAVIVEVDNRGDERIAQSLVRFDVAQGSSKPESLPLRWGWSGDYLYDREGKPRLIVPPVQGHASVQWLHPHGGLSDWQALDEYWPGSGFRFVAPGGTAASGWSVPLGFGRDSSVIYVASNYGAPRFGLYRVDLAGRQKTRLDHGLGDFDGFAPPADPAASPLLRDDATGEVVGIRAVGREAGTLWLDPAFVRVQDQLEEDFPGRSVAIESWDPSHQLFAVIVSSDDDPGRIFIFDASRADLPVEILRRAPRLDREDLGPTQSFAFRLTDGDLMSGYLTAPRSSGGGPAPLLLVLHGGAGARALPGYDAEAQALAKLGYAVARLNDRGSAGVDAPHARLSRDAAALRGDLGECADWLAARFAVDGGAVGVMGRGEGGRVAEAVVAAGPGRFRCAVQWDGFSPKVFRPFSSASDQADAIQKVADDLAEHGLAVTSPKKKWFWQ